MSDTSLSPISRSSFLAPRGGGLESLLSSMFGPGWSAGSFSDLGWSPAMDVVERDGETVVRADLPGMSREDVMISVEGDSLQISGERHSERELDEGGARRLERSWGKFQRSMTLPPDAERDSISARFERGVLEISIPRSGGSRSAVIEITDGDADASPNERE